MNIEYAPVTPDPVFGSDAPCPADVLNPRTSKRKAPVRKVAQSKRHKALLKQPSQYPTPSPSSEVFFFDSIRIVHNHLDSQISSFCQSSDDLEIINEPQASTAVDATPAPAGHPPATQVVADSPPQVADTSSPIPPAEPEVNSTFFTNFLLNRK